MVEPQGCSSSSPSTLEAAVTTTAGQKVTSVHRYPCGSAMRIAEEGSTKAIAFATITDHIGGHILGSQHVPSSSLDYRAPELVRTLADTPTVVFHCALSQQRGPGAALRYLRERSRMGYDKTAADVVAEGGEQAQGAREKPQQQVYVLQGGFVKWQEKYGSDERLTEGYVKDIWEAF